MTKFEMEAEYFRIYLEQLGYTRIKTGRWVEELQDDGEGFPVTLYICPICGHKDWNNTNYCPDCGARLNEE